MDQLNFKAFTQQSKTLIKWKKIAYWMVENTCKWQDQ